MRCTFVCMGAENISIESLSALLKEHGHETSLAYDQALFDDKNYLSKPGIARFFDHKDVVVGQVVQSRPDLVAISVMTPTYTWALDMARRIKRWIDVPIVFGGIHPTTCADKVIQEDCVDIVCKGEGDMAMVELCDAMEEGREDLTIQNLWFKKDGKVIENPQRTPISNLDELPRPDKELFAPHVPIRHSYLAVTSRGCPYACHFCALSYYAEEAKLLGSKRLRERSVTHVIAELKDSLERYDYRWIEFRNNTFTAKRRWVKEFCEAYKREIGRPFLAFAHPSTMNEDVAGWMKEAGCYLIQLGVESYDEWVREHILNRKETNEDVDRAVDAMDKVGLTYSLDYILGLPRQTEEELLKAAQFFIDRKACRRVSPYMLAYLPKLKMVDIGLKYGHITHADVERLESGQHDHYLSAGSVGEDQKKLRYYKNYKVFFRSIPLIPRPLAQFMLDRRLFRYLAYLPVDLLLDLIDYAQVLRPRDYLARTYAKNYIWWFVNRLNPRHPAFFRNSIRNPRIQAIARAHRLPDRRPTVSAPTARLEGRAA
ncbi:MAG: cobalamin B12-binding domain-containing protein [Proteobacteria bacterium]|nr:cobalamin B12-binding domain-containing protein [Pseudomonadota bacterium]